MSVTPAESMPVSEVKATCLAGLERVRRTGDLITPATGAADWDVLAL